MAASPICWNMFKQCTVVTPAIKPTHFYSLRVAFYKPEQLRSSLWDWCDCYRLLFSKISLSSLSAIRGWLLHITKYQDVPSHWRFRGPGSSPERSPLLASSARFDSTQKANLSKQWHQVHGEPAVVLASRNQNLYPWNRRRFLSECYPLVN